MSYLVLARKWRPQRFEDVVGQRHVSVTLTNSIRTGRLSHAYLFAGPRGVGKTSMARILAKALDCEKGPAPEPCNECATCRAITEGHCLDVLEIDGASNRGIDDVRQLRESVKYAPASARAKVYIIDEVHMLTADAFNALLKTLEEPPRHVYFVLATTEPLRVPPTILSRCQRHDFGRLTGDELVANLRRIVAAEGIQIDEDALRLIARKSEGSVRDTLTLLDQVSATGSGPFRAADVQEILGLSGTALYFELSDAVVAGDGRRALLTLEQAYQQGLNLQELADELVHHFRDLLVL
jgi:DNA polymerase-3 subunit gamma/tau